MIGPVDVGAPWGKVIKREVIEKNNLRFVPGLKKGQDTVFSLGLFEAAASFSYVPIMGYHYRVSEGSVSRKYNDRIVGVMERTLGEFHSFCVKNKKPSDFFRAVRRKYYNVLLGEYMEIYFLNRDNPRARKRELRLEFLRLIEREPYKGAIRLLEGGEGRNSLSGIWNSWLLFLLRTRRIRALFDMKRLEFFLRGIIVQRYN